MKKKILIVIADYYKDISLGLLNSAKEYLPKNFIVKTIKVPNKSKKKTIGANQNFFRTLKNSQNSVNIES